MYARFCFQPSAFLDFRDLHGAGVYDNSAHTFFPDQKIAAPSEYSGRNVELTGALECKPSVAEPTGAPGEEAYAAAILNAGMIANAVWTTEQAVKAMQAE